MGIDPVGLGLIAALDRLRDDWREDLGGLEGRVMAAIEGSQREFNEYARAHGDEHLATRAASDAIHSRFDAFVRSSELSQARKDGALGSIRFVLDVAGRNWKLVVALFTALGLALGNVHVNVGLE